jgi:glycosyltransferase involved in cell wall biosynthesis
MGSDTPHLYIIGKGKDRELLKQTACELAIEKKTTFLGFLSNPYPWIRQALAVVHSAKFEGLPTALIEALLLDKLIIATDCPTGPREILGQGKAGILVPVGDAEALAKGMEQLAIDGELRSRLQQGISEQRRLFMPEKCIEQFEQLL